MTVFAGKADTQLIISTAGWWPIPRAQTIVRFDCDRY